MNNRLLQFRQSLAFFTRFPVALTGKIDAVPRLKKVAWCVPLVGLLVGVLSAILLYVVLWLSGSGFVAVVISLAVACLITGALHEDGLADCADALGGGYDQVSRLAILKDSRIGVFGALALLFIVMIKVTVLELMVRHDPLVAMAGLVLMAMTSRFFMLSMAMNQVFNEDDHQSLAASAGGVDFTDMVAPLVFVCAFWGVGLIFVSEFSLFLVFVVLMALVLMRFWLYNWLNQRFGRITGDGFGFTQQLMEVSGLVLICFML